MPEAPEVETEKLHEAIHEEIHGHFVDEQGRFLKRIPAGPDEEQRRGEDAHPGEARGAPADSPPEATWATPASTGYPRRFHSS
jgi:hypothetical protein